MTNNFLDIEKTNNFSNLWRNIFFIILIIGGIGGAGFAYVSYSPDSLAKEVEKNVAVEVTDVPAEEGAGDIVVEPPIEPVVSIPDLQGELPPLDNFGAKSFIVKDNASGAVLFGKEPYALRPIASITKLMSALVLREHDIDWASTTQVVSDDVVDTHMYAGDTYTLEDLWRAGLAASSNKAILTLADATGWSRDIFVERMNQKANELGMMDTHFIEPTGLDAENSSTASDIVLLLHEALRDEKISSALLRKDHSLYSAERKKKHNMWNTNWLLLDWIPHDFEIHGGKTGFIDASGYNFSTQISDAEDRLLDVVVLGATNHEARFTEARDIANAVLKAYSWK